MVEVIFQTKMSNSPKFQLLICEDLFLCEIKLNIFGFWQFDDVTLGFRKLLWIFVTISLQLIEKVNARIIDNEINH